ncbi:dTDP-4-dehydrorhamnose reductase [Cognatilysobacter bugurensis]|uniref:dTDP-4-dehydrorhamnose reductase n=1 Tax=Cognatilysobacter bugurensis TaxID=543356 RepID=A0A918SXF5_9GAMM|nr:dTDP-4-dehydrorhamnose reductase [Lysobacter bugurensis]GHA76539.1 NAD(P)-dependent oxidoreductase [Lysobacter bugurensis]
MTKILLLGAGGQVGHELQRSLAPQGEVVPATRSGQLQDGTPCEALDLAAEGAIEPLIARIAPDIVVNAAAYTAVDRAESEPERAMRINGNAPGELAQCCARRGIRLVHYSTDYVFDGTATEPYTEGSTTAPLGVYGVSKLAGEEAIRSSGVEHLILRTAWVYGLHGHNFLRTMLRLASERDTLRVVADQTGCPTPAWLIADVTAQLVDRGVQGGETYHLVAAGETSWHGFAEAIVRRAHQRGMLTRAPEVVPISSDDYPTPAARPRYSVLDTTSIKSERDVQLPHWTLALERTLGP